MIPATTPARQRPGSSWQRELADAITSPATLLEALGLDPALLPAANEASQAFRLRVPRGFVARMRYGDPTDPLLRQVLPVASEGLEVPGFVSDPLAERDAFKAPGLLHKYHGRALLIATQACAINCRYCFRREFPYEDQTGASALSQAMAAIAADSTLEEIILSGGDPLALSDSRLAAITDQLAGIPHLRRLRVHTRTPVVLPSRVDAGLLAWVQSLPWPQAWVLHINHANEIDASVRSAAAALRGAGVTLLNQTVLLRGINDSAATLAELSGSLFEAGIVPYYLHATDPVRGTSHFHVPDSEACALADQLAARLSGYLVPRLVREIPHATGKTPLTGRDPGL